MNVKQPSPPARPSITAIPTPRSAVLFVCGRSAGVCSSAFMRGALFCRTSLLPLGLQPGGAVFPNDRERLGDRIDANRDLEIDLTRQLTPFHEHGSARPFHEARPHLTDDDQGGIIQMPDLEELPAK